MEEPLPYTPHSLLDAVKLAASAAGMEWAAAHRYYRDLQGATRSDSETTWLPKSLGRNIWYAHPNYLAAFFTAVGMTDDASLACPIVTFAFDFTPGGRKRNAVETDEHPVRNVIASLLSNPTFADGVERVEFDPMRLRVEIYYRDGDCKFFADPDAADGETPTIYRRGVIPGAVFSALSRTINWRVDAPLKVPEGGIDPEA